MWTPRKMANHFAGKKQEKSVLVKDILTPQGQFPKGRLTAFSIMTVLQGVKRYWAENADEEPGHGDSDFDSTAVEECSDPDISVPSENMVFIQPMASISRAPVAPSKEDTTILLGAQSMTHDNAFRIQMAKMARITTRATKAHRALMAAKKRSTKKYMSNRRLFIELENARTEILTLKAQHFNEVMDIEEAAENDAHNLEREYNNKYESLEAEHETVKKELESLTKHKEHAEKEWKKKNFALQKLKGDHKMLTGRLENEKLRHGKLRADHESTSNQLWLERSQYGNDQPVIDSLRQRVASLEHALGQQAEGSNSDMVAEDTARGIAGLQMANTELRDTVASLEADVEHKNQLLWDSDNMLARYEREDIYNETEECLNRALRRVHQWKSHGEAFALKNEHAASEIHSLSTRRIELESTVKKLKDEVEVKDKELHMLRKNNADCLEAREKDFRERREHDAHNEQLRTELGEQFDAMRRLHDQREAEIREQTTLAKELKVKNEHLMARHRCILETAMGGWDEHKIIREMTEHMDLMSSDRADIVVQRDRNYAAKLEAEQKAQYFQALVNDQDIDAKHFEAQEEIIQAQEAEIENLRNGLEIRKDVWRDMEDAQRTISKLTKEKTDLRLEIAHLNTEKLPACYQSTLKYLRSRVAVVTAAVDCELEINNYKAQHQWGDGTEEILELQGKLTAARCAAHHAAHRSQETDLEHQRYSKAQSRNIQRLQVMLKEAEDKQAGYTAEKHEMVKQCRDMALLDHSIKVQIDILHEEAAGTNNPVYVGKQNWIDLQAWLGALQNQNYELMAANMRLADRLRRAVQPAPMYWPFLKMEKELDNLRRYAKRQMMAIINLGQLETWVLNGMDAGKRHWIDRLKKINEEQSEEIKELKKRHILLKLPRDCDFMQVIADHAEKHGYVDPKGIRHKGTVDNSGWFDPQGDPILGLNEAPFDTY